MNSMINGMVVNLNVFGALMEGWVVHMENSCLVITIHWHGTSY